VTAEQAVSSGLPSGKCQAVNRFRKRCGAWASSGSDYCPAHSGQNMRAVGQKGGQKSPGSKAVQAGISKDDPLRDKARDRLDEMLDSPNEQIRMRAATSLFGYGVDRPETEQQRRGWTDEKAGKPTADLLKTMKILQDAYGGQLPDKLLPSPGEIMGEPGLIGDDDSQPTKDDNQ
jgi:hypothetical protein